MRKRPGSTTSGAAPRKVRRTSSSEPSFFASVGLKARRSLTRQSLLLLTRAEPRRVLLPSAQRMRRMM